MTFLFRIISVLLGAAAVYFGLTNNFDWAFAFTAFAVCSYFLGMRFQIKKRLDARAEADAAASEIEPPA